MFDSRELTTVVEHLVRHRVVEIDGDPPVEAEGGVGKGSAD